jgi:lactoylglutathione lyase
MVPIKGANGRANNMKFGYAVIFVDDVRSAIEFYEQAFGLERGLVTQAFATLRTGDTQLAFGWTKNERKELGGAVAFRENRRDDDAAGAQVSLIADDVDAAFQRAVSAGATPIITPTRMPWGQTVSRVRDLNGFLVSLVTAPKF